MKLYETFAPVSDYLVINVSSPNTPGLRDLGEKSKITEILQGLEDVRKQRPCPLFIKVSPDMSEQGLQDFVDIAQEFRLNAINEENLSKLFALFIIETVIVGNLIKINPFDQPAVEKVKDYTKQFLVK